MNIPLYTLILCTLIIGCTNKPKQEEIPQAPINNAVGINDTLGLFLHSEYPVYSTKLKQVTFVLHNNSGTDIGFGGYYSYTYEDEDGYITEPNIVRSVDPSLDKEALRIIKTLPQWKPGTLKGKTVKVKYAVPVAFKLSR